MKREEIPGKCQNCIYMKAWSIHMDGNHEYTCWRLPNSMVGDPNCGVYEERRQEVEE